MGLPGDLPCGHRRQQRFHAVKRQRDAAERGAKGDARSDKWVGGAWSLIQFFALPLAAGLDVRYGWSGIVNLAVHLGGAILFAAGLALFSWAMITNAFFSTTAEIQSERGQTVCRSGPYRFVRHPGYTGTNLQSFGIALLLGSWWALRLPC